MPKLISELRIKVVTDGLTVNHSGSPTNFVEGDMIYLNIDSDPKEGFNVRNSTAYNSSDPNHAACWTTLSLGGGGGGGLDNVVEDTTPQLGGNLDLNGNDIVTGDGKIVYAAGDAFSEIDLTYNGANNHIGIASVKSIDLFLDTNGGDTNQNLRVFNNLQPTSSHAGGTNTDGNAIWRLHESGTVYMTNNIDMGTNIITDAKVAQWDAAYGWGDHGGSSYLTAEADTLATVTGRGAATTTTAVIPFFYANQSAFPNATTYHGAVAHSHSDGAMYFAHGGSWVKLANDSSIANAANWNTAYGWGDHSTAGYTSNAGDITAVTAGNGLSGGGTTGAVTLDLDFSELTDMTGTMDSTDEFIILDSGTGEKRKAAQEIGLSIFNNDAGFTNNAGDITAVVAGIGITGGATSGNANISLTPPKHYLIDFANLSGTGTGAAILDGTSITQWRDSNGAGFAHNGPVFYNILDGDAAEPNEYICEFVNAQEGQNHDVFIVSAYEPIGSNQIYRMKAGTKIRLINYSTNPIYIHVDPDHDADGSSPLTEDISDLTQGGANTSNGGVTIGVGKYIDLLFDNSVYKIIGG